MNKNLAQTMTRRGRKYKIQRNEDGTFSKFVNLSNPTKVSNEKKTVKPSLVNRGKKSTDSSTNTIADNAV